MIKVIQRPRYLQALADRRENGSVKVVTGIRRCGKSFLLFRLFRSFLLSQGVTDDHIIQIPLDSEEFESLHERHALGDYIREQTRGSGLFYVLLDEIQFVPGFESLLNSLVRKDNLDIYVTGSNSKFLSSDILTEFRGRGDEVRVRPLLFSEFCSADPDRPRDESWRDYITYGGLPQILAQKSGPQKSAWLKNVLARVYLKDIVERNGFENSAALESVTDFLASSVGSLTNPLRLAKTFQSHGMPQVSEKTVSQYIRAEEDAFLIEKAKRFDIKGKRYIDSPFKYYFTDIGIRNARLNFRQPEENHVMENILFNELMARGFNVDVGVVPLNAKTADGRHTLQQLEVDFVCNEESRRFYIQSAFSIPDAEKMAQETNSLSRISDSFKKIVIVRDRVKKWYDDRGILFMGIEEFLLDEASMNY